MSINTGPISVGWPDENSDEGGAGRRKTVILGGIAVVLATIVAIATVVVVATHPGANSADLALVADTTTGTDPFGPSVSLTNKPLRNDVRLSSSAGTLTGRGIRTVSGTTAGLYGGTGDSTCDVAKLANYLSENQDKARAWAGVFGISRSEIPYYLDSLTPVVLTSDTWVTNHSYSNGVADPFQAILQAGTAVLVDESGVPRVRCSCGNPLGPSASAPLADYHVAGERWPGYQARSVVYVSYTTTNNTTVAAAPGIAPQPASLSLVNTDTATALMRTVGGLLDLTGLPPLAAALPTSASLNTPFRSDDPEVRAANGIGVTESTTPASVLEAPAPARQQAAAEVAAPTIEATPEINDPTAVALPPSAPVSTGPSSAPASVPPPAESSPPVAAPAAAPAPAAPPAPSPTAFTGSGPSVVAMTFPGDGGTPVSCTVPAPVAETTAATETTATTAPAETSTPTETPTETTATGAPTAVISPSASVVVTLTCDSTVIYTADIADLTSAAVTTATDPTRIWTASLQANGSPVRVPVMTATYGG